MTMIGKEPFRQNVEDALAGHGTWIRAARIELSTESQRTLFDEAHRLAYIGFNVDLHAGAKGWTAHGIGSLSGLEIDMKMDKR